MELPKNTGMNIYAIKLIDRKKPFYGPIYILNPIKLETFKIYIKMYLKTGFIQQSKSLVDTTIFFDKKPNISFCLCLYYQYLNNFTI